MQGDFHISRGFSPAPGFASFSRLLFASVHRDAALRSWTRSTAGTALGRAAGRRGLSHHRDTRSLCCAAPATPLPTLLPVRAPQGGLWGPGRPVDSQTWTERWLLTSAWPGGKQRLENLPPAFRVNRPCKSDSTMPRHAVRSPVTILSRFHRPAALGVGGCFPASVPAWTLLIGCQARRLPCCWCRDRLGPQTFLLALGGGRRAALEALPPPAPRQSSAGRCTHAP